MIHQETKWPIVWATRYNDAVKNLDKRTSSYDMRGGEIHRANTKIGKLENSLRVERALNDTLSEERNDARKRAEASVGEIIKFQKQSDAARVELKALKKRLSDNAIPTRDQRSGRYKKRA